MVSEPGGISGVLDQTLNHALRVGLSLASLRGSGGLNSAAIAQIDQARSQLDVLVATIHTAAFSEVVTGREDGAHDIPSRARRLCRLSIDSVFAYSRGSIDFVRIRDGALWAHESDGVLLSARGGRPLARRDGRVFSDTETHEPLYYEQPALDL